MPKWTEAHEALVVLVRLAFVNGHGVSATTDRAYITTKSGDVLAVIWNFTEEGTRYYDVDRYSPEQWKAGVGPSEADALPGVLTLNEVLRYARR